MSLLDVISAVLVSGWAILLIAAGAGAMNRTDRVVAIACRRYLVVNALFVIVCSVIQLVVSSL